MNSTPAADGYHARRVGSPTGRLDDLAVPPGQLAKPVASPSHLRQGGGCHQWRDAGLYVRGGQFMEQARGIMPLTVTLVGWPAMTAGPATLAPPSSPTPAGGVPMRVDRGFNAWGGHKGSLLPVERMKRFAAGCWNGTA